MIKTITYAPDLDTTLPGVLTDCEQAIPTKRGMAAAPGAASTPLPALAATCQGAALLTRLDGQTKFFAATGTDLYEAGTATWTSVSGSTYTATTTFWRFAQYGNISLATSKQNFLQSYTATAFSTVTTAPKAAIILTVGDFVMALDTDDAGVYGDRPDSWWCAGIGTHNSWTPSIATQAATGRLTSIPGAVTAGRKFGDQVFAGKERGCYLGTYTGPPFIWSWSELPGESGPVSQEACLQIGTPEQPRLMFLGRDNFYLFDGTRPYPIGNQIRDAFYSLLNSSSAANTHMLYDRARQLVWVYFPAGSSTTPNRCFVYHIKEDRWGRADRAVEYVVDYTTPSLTYDGLSGSYNVAYDSLPSVPYDQLFVTPGAIAVPGLFDSAHTIKTLNGSPEPSRIVTGDSGDDSAYTLVRRIRMRWNTKPTYARLTAFKRGALGDALATGQMVTAADQTQFELLQVSRWHRFGYEFQGQWELNTITVDGVQSGLE